MNFFRKIFHNTLTFQLVLYFFCNEMLYPRYILQNIFLFFHYTRRSEEMCFSKSFLFLIFNRVDYLNFPFFRSRTSLFTSSSWSCLCAWRTRIRTKWRINRTPLWPECSTLATWTMELASNQYVGSFRNIFVGNVIALSKSWLIVLVCSAVIW